jgi:hypothetical protein
MEIGVGPLQVSSAFATIANDGRRLVPGAVKPIPAPHLSDFPSPGKFSRLPPTVIYQISPEGSGGSGKELLYWAQVFGIVFTALTAFTAQLMMWIGLNRKRVEGTLLRLDIEKRRLEIEQLRIALEQAQSKSG